MRTKITIVAATIALLSAGYVCAYFGNLDQGWVMYLPPDPTPSSRRRDCPKFIVLQETSEVVFWPVYHVHMRTGDDRFRWNIYEEETWPDERPEWWF